jgi:hypothetical protein
MYRKLLIAIAATALIIIMSSFAMVSYQAKKTPEEFWKQLGKTEQEIKEQINLCFINEGGLYAMVQKTNSLAPGDRAAITTEAMKYTKQYINTADFEKEYQQIKESLKPKTFVAAVKTKETIREEYIKRNEIVIQNLQKQLLLSTTDAFFKKAYTEHIAEAKREIEDYKKPNSLSIDNARRLEQENSKKLNERFKGLAKQWEINYPQNYQQRIKAKLVKFLGATNGIDYKASVIERNQKQIFANPTYEAKSTAWKTAFYAGKEVTETARTFVQQWIKELN